MNESAIAEVVHAVRTDGWARVPAAMDSTSVDQLGREIQTLVRNNDPNDHCLYLLISRPILKRNG